MIKTSCYQRKKIHLCTWTWFVRAYKMEALIIFGNSLRRLHGDMESKLYKQKQKIGISFKWNCNTCCCICGLYTDPPCEPTCLKTSSRSLWQPSADDNTFVLAWRHTFPRKIWAPLVLLPKTDAVNSWPKLSPFYSSKKEFEKMGGQSLLAMGGQHTGKVVLKTSAFLAPDFHCLVSWPRRYTHWAETKILWIRRIFCF